MHYANIYVLLMAIRGIYPTHKQVIDSRRCTPFVSEFPLHHPFAHDTESITDVQCQINENRSSHTN